MPLLKQCFSIILFLFILSTPAIAQTEAIASVSNNNLVEGDFFKLTVTVNNSGSQYNVDTSALKNNFEIGSPSRQQETIYDNGEWKKRLTWSFTLKATKTGKFMIPPLKVGDVSTQAIEINVSEAKQSDQSTANDAIFIENTINKTTTYINQPIILEAKIYISGRFNNGQIQAPQLKDAEVEQISGNNSNIVKNGLRYDLYTYQYKVTPTTSGEFNINSAILTGAVFKPIQTNSLQQRMTSVPVNIRGNNIKLTVNEMPENYQAGWIISEDVRLNENNNLQEKEYFVGDPITRSISLQVASIDLEKMPEIKMNYDNSVRYYPDKDELAQGRANNLVYSQRTITHAIIPNKSGPLVLPEIKIPWWNSKTEKQEFATLPAQTITIKPALVTGNSDIKKTDNQVESDINAMTTLPLSSGEVEKRSPIVNWKISTLVLLGLLILLIIYHLYIVNKYKLTPVKKQNKIIQTEPYQRLLSVLKQEDINQSYLALLVYFQSQYSNIIHLQQISEYTHLDDKERQELIANIAQLELACAGKSHNWSAKTLSKLIILHHKKTTTQKISNAIIDINP